MSARALAAPLHRHTREDEYSYVIEGRMGALLGDEVLEAGPGDLVFKPRGEWHTFWNAGDEPCRILEIIAPAGFEGFFAELVDLGGVGQADPRPSAGCASATRSRWTRRASPASSSASGCASRGSRTCDSPPVTGDPYLTAQGRRHRDPRAPRGASRGAGARVRVGRTWWRRWGRSGRQVPMSDLPGFPAPVVQGHSGMAHSLEVGGVPLLVLAGRSHLYEEHPVSVVVHGVRAAVLAGCRAVMLTNAAGSLEPANGPGTPVLISDHLNLTGVNPMTGVDPPEGFPARFCDLADLYSPRLRAAAAAPTPGIPEGVYAGLLGGSYETPAEIRMLRGHGRRPGGDVDRARGDRRRAISGPRCSASRW